MQLGYDGWPIIRNLYFLAKWLLIHDDHLRHHLNFMLHPHYDSFSIRNFRWELIKKWRRRTTDLRKWCCDSALNQSSFTTKHEQNQMVSVFKNGLNFCNACRLLVWILYWPGSTNTSTADESIIQVQRRRSWIVLYVISHILHHIQHYFTLLRSHLFKPRAYDLRHLFNRIFPYFCCSILVFAE